MNVNCNAFIDWTRTCYILLFFCLDEGEVDQDNVLQMEDCEFYDVEEGKSTGVQCCLPFQELWLHISYDVNQLVNVTMCKYTVEPLYYGHQEGRNKCPYYRGVRFREISFVWISLFQGQVNCR